MKPTIETKLETLGARVTDLADGRRGLLGTVAVKATTPSGVDGPVLDFIASDDTLDRYDEVIDANGWRLDNYRRNPVFQNSHRYGDIMNTLGKSLITEVHAGALYQRIEFAIEENPVAKIAYGLYRGGFLNAVSVGFIPIRWEMGSQDAGYRRKYIEQELLELSAVSIPANPNALVLGLKSGAVAKDDLEHYYEFYMAAVAARAALNQSCSNQEHNHQAGSGSNARAPGSGTDGAQLLQLARAVRDVLAA